MGKSLVIVESPAKARTIAGYLGGDFVVESSIGHVRDLPRNASEIPPRYKKEPWARLGVNVEEHFEPLYVIPREKREQVKKLKALLAEADTLYLATDEDREGESIAWHLREVLKPRVPVHRMVFHEITRRAILQALQQTRDIDERLVRAQEARRILDRLFGYEVSPLLWRKVRPRLSAGRVQSVAVRLLVEREQARMAFRPAIYWDVLGRFEAHGEAFQARLLRLGERQVASGADFSPETGRLKRRDRVLLDAERAAALVERLRSENAVVVEVERKGFRERPSPPFITSTLQQDANRKFHWTARRTMQVAQWLYEHGWITYMRTDSVALSDEALEATRQEIQQRYGPDYLPRRARRYRSTSRNAQEAHEAIRPAVPFRSPEQARTELDLDAARLYELVWLRTMASQMPDARGTRVRALLRMGPDGEEAALFLARGRHLEFPGYRRAYTEAQEGNREDEGRLPPLELGDPARLLELQAQEHQTQPPKRLSEAALVKELEARGIGRPSTYATIIDTIQARGYVFKKGNVLVPTFTAFAVTRLLETTLADLVDYAFTAQMEDELDRIAAGELDPETYLSRFYFGEGEGLRDRVQRAIEQVDPREVCTLSLDGPDAPLVRVGRYGPYLEWGEARRSLDEQIPPDELDAERARALLAEEERWPRKLGTDPETGLPVLLQHGRYGFYVQLGEDEPKGAKNGRSRAAKPRRASLLRGMDPAEVDLELALQLLSLPRTLGLHPESGEPVLAANGRYGPYVKCGSESRSLPPELDPLHVTLEEALQLLAAPKRRRGGGRRKQAGKELGSTPQGKVVRLLEGRYGPYVTDGELNASLPRDLAPEEVTLERAVELLEARAARGGRRRKRR